MKALSTQLRNQLERAVVDARNKAEEGAYAAMERLGVHKREAFEGMTADQRALRGQLRAKAKQLGDERQGNGEQDMYRLHRECAYEQWHQMLFARFLAENHLLMHPDGVPVTLEECEELAAAQRTDGWTLAARYASKMLPQIFRPDDPLLKVAFAPEDKQALEEILAALPAEVFTADDSLGWCYQFWQKKQKDEVNESGKKIGADELPAVTQLFTEDYMVKFLLHNTLGAWWAGKQLHHGDTEGTETEQELREKVALPGVDWEYLRFVRESEKHHADTEDTEKTQEPSSSLRDLRASVVKSPWRPAAGTFPGWPKTAAELKILDPCCGSGHFLVAAFEVMVALRMREEGLSAREACDAVLRDNLFGLEIDQRCCQIAAFALALAAWRCSDAGGYRPLPELHIACTGIAPQASEEQWLKLAEQSGRPMHTLGREPILNGLRNLHALFSQAPVLGSLIDPSQLPSNLIAADYETLQPYLAAALSGEHADEETHERAVAAQGMVKAAELLSGEYHLVITNVPYLGRGRQDERLKKFCDQHFPDSIKDLATASIERALEFTRRGSYIAMVTPHNWLSLKSYEVLRRKLLRVKTWPLVARLGPRAFETISGEVVNVALVIVENNAPIDGDSILTTVDVNDASDARAKANALRDTTVLRLRQSDVLRNPDSRLLFAAFDCKTKQLGDFCEVLQGSSSGDDPKFLREFWEIAGIGSDWKCLLSAPDRGLSSGRETVWRWADDECELARFPQARIRGKTAWGHEGFVVAGSSRISVTVYHGEFYNKLLVSLIPKTGGVTGALWKYLCSEEFAQNVRRLDTKNLVSPGVFASLPFDEERWTAMAKGELPPALLETDDPTQWIFHGWPEQSTAPLQVSIARLLGYRWPAELEGPHPNPLPEGEKQTSPHPSPLPEGEGTGMRLSTRARELVKRCDELLRFADADGIVCIPAVSGEQPAADRLSALLAACGIKPDRNLDDWLRDGFFDEHCKLFHQRPFIWHLWDGLRKDGFHALVNYHKLDRNRLEKLIYTYLGDWIARQKAAEQRGESGAEARLLAAEDLQNRLKLVLEGEPPYDIFVRWKPLEEQPIGWEPDLNDGVRMNIRPFVEAGVLRKNPNIKWTKDRGKEPDRDRKQFPWFWEGGVFTGDRVNDVHLTLKEKREARNKHKLK